MRSVSARSPLDRLDAVVLRAVPAAQVADVVGGALDRVGVALPHLAPRGEIVREQDEVAELPGELGRAGRAVVARVIELDLHGLAHLEAA
jgi:hypothetical protein